MPLKEGTKAPAFTALDDRGREVRLDDHHGRLLVLFFYPKDDTPGCTAEACDFRDHLVRVKRTGARVLGVSPDGADSHAKFKSKHGLTFPLLADEDKRICRAYRVWKKKSMYGRQYMGVERTTYIVGPDGMIARVFAKVRVPGHVDAVLAALKELKT